MIYCRCALWLPTLNYYCEICTFIHYKDILQPWCYRCHMYWDTNVFSWVCKQLKCKMFRLLLMVLFALQLSLQCCHNFILSIKATDDKAAEISAALSLFLCISRSGTEQHLCRKWPIRGTMWPFLTVALVVLAAAVRQPWGEAVECGWSRTWRAYAWLRVSGRMSCQCLF